MEKAQGTTVLKNLWKFEKKWFCLNGKE